MAANGSLKLWMKRQAAFSATAMLSSIGATTLTKTRPAFGQSVTPLPGSIVASTVMANWDPEPDYFSHWWRDAAVVLQAVNILCQNQPRKWSRVFNQAVQFNLQAMTINGAAFQNHAAISARTDPEFRKYLRSNAEIAQIYGDRVLADTRINPDGTPDILTWARPQYDGPALLAIACMEHWDLCVQQNRVPSDSLYRLIDRLLDFTHRHAGLPCIDLWEVDGNIDYHYYTELVQLGAMEQGAEWAARQGQALYPRQYREAAAGLRASLDQNWSDELGVIKTARNKNFTDAAGAIDASVILAVNQTGIGLRDDRVLATVAKLEELFAEKYPINHERSEGIAIGRSRDDNFFGNNPWYWTTAALGEFYYRLAVDIKTNGPLTVTDINRNFCRRFSVRTAETQAGTLIRRGDAQMQVIRDYTPKDQSFSEQFNAVSGKLVSARNLAMSYAGFINAASYRPA